MNLGLQRSHLDIINELLIKPFKAKSVKLWIFGSRARGNFQKFSDLDVLFDGHCLDLSFVSSIKERLEESALPIKVDLVDSQFLAESYRDQVEKEKILLDIL